tara:strand:+ start:2035 stop:2391 length:357 start_codon:yes stop_codon:yes gene_type:complete
MTLNKKIICFDLDNVICKTLGNNYKKSVPIKKNIKTINKLYKKGNYIKIFTARFMGRTNEDAKKAKKLAENITKHQLKKWKVNYHKLIFGKPSYDIYVDDKSLFFDKNWSKKLIKKFI